MFSIDDIQTQPDPKAPFIMMYGLNGVGKTTFITSAKNPFVIDTENKYNNTNVKRYVPKDYNSLLGCLSYLLSLDAFPGNVLAIDTLDWLEKRIHENMCSEFRLKNGNPVSNINEAAHEQLNFGKGSKIASNIFNSQILEPLEAIRNKFNIPIILAAQAAKVPVNLPDVEKHDVIDLRVDKVLAGFISDRVEAKLYMRIRYYKDQKGNKIPSKDRYMVAVPQQGIVAKNNLNLPDEFLITKENGWDDFINALGMEVAK